MKRDIIAALALAAASGCGWGAKTCAIIDTAHDACVVLRYLTPTGEVREVRVSRDELQTFALHTAAAQAAAAQDGGAP